MIAIRVRFMHPTNHRGARWQATDGRNYLYAPCQYGKDTDEKLALAEQFRLKFTPQAPELNPTPSQFNHDDYFSFLPKADQKKLDKIASQILDKYGIQTGGTIAQMIMEAMKTVL